MAVTIKSEREIELMRESCRLLEEMDDEVVAICTDWIMEIKGFNELSNEEVRSRLAAIGLSKAI